MNPLPVAHRAPRIATKPPNLFVRRAHLRSF